MKMSLVRGMPLIPHACVACGSMGEVTEEGLPEAVFVEGVDINWGDSVYLCRTCARIAGELVGCSSPEVHENMVNQIRELQARVAELKESDDVARSQIKRMLDGARARKEAKEVVRG